jgi:hypothetical protein
VSIREQERRQRESARRIEKSMREADKHVRGSIMARQKEAEGRAKDIIRRIEKGDVDPRPLPGVREDSLASMESMPSMQSMDSTPSIESADTVSGVTGEAEAQYMQEGMPLEGVMPYNPKDAHEDLAQRVTEETGSDGDPHAHNEAKADELAKSMTEDTDADGDMVEHAEGKVENMGQEMFED